MGASESKTDGIDVDVDVADAPVDKTPTPTGSTLSEVDDAKPATPQAVYRTADAPEAGALDKYGKKMHAPASSKAPRSSTRRLRPDSRAERSPPPRPRRHGGAEYVLRFEDEDQVAPFCKAIKAGAELAALDRIKDNLGHPRPPRTDSTLYADKVGKEFASKQPEHEVTAADATELGALGVAPGVGPVYH